MLLHEFSATQEKTFKHFFTFENVVVELKRILCRSQLPLISISVYSGCLDTHTVCMLQTKSSYGCVHFCVLLQVTPTWASQFPAKNKTKQYYVNFLHFFSQKVKEKTEI